MEQDIFSLAQPVETPSAASAIAPEADAPYPPPKRACYVCGENCWQWDPTQHKYVCASRDPEHEARASWPWLIPTGHSTPNI